MSYWVEIHCDERKDGIVVAGKSFNCWTFSNRNPAAMSKTSENAISRAVSGARRAGWVIRKVGWVCPYCQRH